MFGVRPELTQGGAPFYGRVLALPTRLEMLARDKPKAYYKNL
jgi:hypothetical protein